MYNRKHEMKNIYLILLFVITNLSAYSQWQSIDLPFGYENDYWLEIYFLPNNPDYGWVCGFGGNVLRTTDGGNTWKGTNINNADQLENIFFVNERVGFTISVGDQMDGSRIFKSTDGGVSWRDISPSNNLDLWGCYFLDENYGVMLGGNCVGFQGFIRTTDGGNSWAMTRYSVDNTRLADLILYPDNTGYAVSSGKLWFTNNKGKDWKVIANTGPEDWHEELCKFKNSFLVPADLTCNGSQNGGSVRFSIDGGKNWRIKELPQAMYGAFLISENEGWVCGLNQEIYQTKDAGLTWTLRNCGIESANLDDFYFFNDSTGFVVGNGIYKLVKIDTLKPIISANKEKICRGGKAVLTADKDYKQYLWSTGDTTKSISVSVPGDYYLVVQNDKCDRGTSNHIKIDFFDYPDPIYNIPDNYKLCEGDTVTVKILNKFQNIEWYDGSQSYEKEFHESGVYYISVTDTNGCSADDSLVIEVVPLPTPKILAAGKTVLCTNEYYKLYIDGQYSDIQWYNSETGNLIAKDTNSIYINKSGTYSVIVKSMDNCSGPADTLSVTIENDSNHIAIDYNLTNLPFMIDSTKYGSVPCRALAIKNISGEMVKLDYAFLKINKTFSVPPSQFPLYIAPYDSSYLVVCYSPSALGLEKDTLIIDDICSAHYVRVLGFGEFESDTIDSKCGMEVICGTKGLNNYIHYSSGLPAPSPAISIISVDYSLEYESKAPEIKANIIDLLGNKSCIDIKKISDKRDTFAESGKLNFDVGNYESGLYILELIIDTKSIFYKVLIY